QITSELNRRLGDLLTPEDRVYVRIAKMHAIMRGIRASYLNTNGNLDRDPYDPNSVGSVQFNYEVDINRLSLFQLYPRTIWIPASLVNPEGASRETLEKYGRQNFVANLVSVFDEAPKNVLIHSGHTCPPVPSASVAARYDVNG